MVGEMRCRGACMAGVCVCVWQGACVAEGACMAKGHAWQGVCVAGGVCGQGGHAWQERRPLQQTVRILVEYILLVPYFLRILLECILLVPYFNLQRFRLR